MTSKKSLNNNVEANFLTFGSLNLFLILHLQKEDIINYNIIWRNLNSLNDLKFLRKNINLWKRVELSSDKDTLKLVIQMNKITPNKIKIRYLCFNSTKYSNEEIDFFDLISYVTTENGLYIDSCEICQCDMKIQLKIYFEKEEKVFMLLNEEGEKNDNSNNDSNRIKDKSSEEKDNLFTYIIKEIVNPNNFNYIYFDYSDYTCGDFKDVITVHDLYEYCVHLKLTTSSKIILNLKEEINDTKEFKSLLSIIDICIFYDKNILFEILQKIKYNDDKTNKKEEHLINHYFAKINKDKKEEGKNKKFKIIKLKNISLNNNIEDSKNKNIEIKRTPKVNKTISQNNSKITLKKIKSFSPRLLDKVYMFKYYKKGICDKDPIHKNNKKTIIVFDKFYKIYFIGCLKSENQPSISDYDLKIYPKVNIHNISEVKEYKEFMLSKFNEYIILFIGSLLSVIVSKGKESCDEGNLLLSYLIAVNFIKKISEIEKNKLPLPVDKNFYYFNINKNEFDKLIEKGNEKKKENLFILDCSNKNDKIKQYNPLLDKYLSQFFFKKKNKDLMKSKGFINETGKILYDPLYKDSLGMSPKYKRNIRIDDSIDNLSNEKLSFNSCGNSPKKRIIKLEVNKYIIGHNQKSPKYYIYKDILKSRKLLPFLGKSHPKIFSADKKSHSNFRVYKKDKNHKKRFCPINIKSIFDTFLPKK